MNTKLPIIEKFIVSKYPDVLDVDFEQGKTKITYMDVSNPERVEYTEIIITINNLKDNLNDYDLSSLREKIFIDLDENLGLGISKLKSAYDVTFRIASKQDFNDYFTKKRRGF
jgi:hypothetical protein